MLVKRREAKRSEKREERSEERNGEERRKRGEKEHYISNLGLLRREETRKC